VAPDGREVNAVHGVVETTLALLREPDVTHLGAATDHVIRSFRNRLWPGYKTEAGVPEDLLAQFPLVERALEAIGVTVWPMVEFEADDALAAAAERYASDVEQTVICTPDKDLAQCVTGSSIVQRDRRRKITYDEDGVRQKFGVSPVSIPDWLALVGDAADGYPRASGLGRQVGQCSALALEASRRHPGRPPAMGGGRTRRRSPGSHAEGANGGRVALSTAGHTATRRATREDARGSALAWRSARALLALCDELGFERSRERPHRWCEEPLSTREPR
jgi:hypothetical protein